MFGNPIDKLSFYAKIPPHALPMLSQAIDQGKVNFVGLPPAEAKVDNGLKIQISKSPSKTVSVTVQLFENPSSEQIEILNTFMTIKGISDGPAHLVRGHIETGHILTLAQQPFVQWVEEQILNESGSLKGNTNQDKSVIPSNFEGNMATGSDVVKQLGFDGSGIRIAVIDSGIARDGTTYHPDLPESRIVDQYYWDPTSNTESADATADDAHGTHVTGSIGGSGTRENDQVSQGIAPSVDFLIYRLCCDVPGGWGYDDLDFEASLQRAANNNAHIVNNSWGGGNGEYGTNAQLVDRAMRGEYNNQYMNMVIITHNDEDISRSPGTAKNALTVGAVKDGNWPPVDIDNCPAGGTFDNWPPGERVCFSNFGPVDADGDGETRVALDIMAPGVQIRSTVPWYLYGDSRYYDMNWGTSMAAPQVSGAVAQFLNVHNNFIDWPEIVKAAFIASATDVGGNANVNTYGYGMLNTFHAIYNQTNISNILFWTASLTSTGNTNNHTFTVPDEFQEVRVALTWADPVSGGGSDDVVNDLDITVYDGNGTQVGLSETSDDTVEYVKINSGTSGTWRIEVEAHSILSLQDYGLVSLVILKNLDLSISGCTYPATNPSSYFFLYSAIANRGFAAPGSYIQLRLPNVTDYAVEGARIYTRDGRSHYYDDTELHHSSSGQYWRVAVGETISGYPRIVRWLLNCTATDCATSSFQTTAYYRNAGSTSIGDASSVTFSQCTSAEMPYSVYLPIVIKQN